MRLGLLAMVLLGVGLAFAAGPKPSTFDPREKTIAETLEAIRTHRVTCRQLVEFYQARVLEYDQATRLNSMVVMNPQALADADALDAEFRRTGKLRALHGIVLIVKDNYDTAGLQTTGGSLALKGFKPATDATMVAKLRAAGAVVLGKSNMAEWAFSPVLTESSIAGVTRNPYALDRVPAGSSGGTAAAVAANFGQIGLGTDTGDSIRGPASHQALVGIRPTIGLTSRDGIIPLSSTNDVGGPLVRSVADAAVVQGYDPADPITALGKGNPTDYSGSLKKDGLRGARIGVVRSYFETKTTDPEIKALTERALDQLRAQGAVVVDHFALPEYEYRKADPACGGFEFDLDNYFQAHGAGAPVQTLAEVIESGLYLGSVAERLKHAAQTPLVTVACPDTYHDAAKLKFRDAILALMDRDKLDALVYPTWSNAPRLVGDLKSAGGDNSQVICPMTGFPGITVPMGWTHGDALPAGLTFVGRSFSEGLLFRLAYGYEQGTKWRRAPGLFP